MGRGYSGYGFASDTGNTTTWLPIGGEHLTGVTKLRATAGRYGGLGLALRGDGRLVVWGRNEIGLHGTGLATEGPASGCAQRCPSSTSASRAMWVMARAMVRRARPQRPWRCCPGVRATSAVTTTAITASAPQSFASDVRF